MGEPNGWKYMDALHENIAQYTHSGSKPCCQAGNGEFPIGISFEYRANTIKSQGAPDRPHLPEGRPGVGHGGVAIMKNTKKLDAAKKLRRLGFVRSAAMEQYAKNYAPWSRSRASRSRCRTCPRTTRSGSPRTTSRGRPRTATSILAEWIKRYDAKSEPK